MIMEILFLMSTLCLLAFVILATYDGAYLHLWKYELFNKSESQFEHFTHTLRALLFPFIIWTLFIATTLTGFIVGLVLVAVDLIVLAIDAYSEKESRSFMNGLPRWEYILHLFANSFHFAAVVLMIGVRLEISPDKVTYTTEYLTGSGFELIQFIAINVLPGAIILGLVHLALCIESGRKIWDRNRVRITCC